jgi:arylsulfatase A-like enzyme
VHVRRHHTARDSEWRFCGGGGARVWQTGRYPWGVGYYDMKGPESIPLSYKLVAELLADAGFETHAIGK